MTGVPAASSRLLEGEARACQLIWGDMGLAGGQTVTWTLRTRGTLSLDPTGRPRFGRWTWACAGLRLELCRFLMLDEGMNYRMIYICLDGDWD